MSDRTILWIQLIGLLGVFLGIVMVIAQLRQNEEVLRWQIGTELLVIRAQNEARVIGENFSDTLAKLHSDPNSINQAEKLQFDAYAFNLVNEWRLRKSLNQSGILKSGWKAYIGEDACFYFNHPHGRAWLMRTDRAYVHRDDDEVKSEISRQLESCEKAEHEDGT